VELLDAGDVEGLGAHLKGHPKLVRQRVTFERGNYFRNPTLLEFVAENPVRRGTLPANIVEVAKVILDAGAKEDQAALDEALGLVCSGCVPRECHVQVPLIDLLCGHGADPSGAMSAALPHREFEAVDALIRNGARVDLVVAAGLGRVDEFRRLLASANDDANYENRQRALALASQLGYPGIVRLLLDAGEDPNRYNPVGTHAHSTPLHQAAAGGHAEVVRLLVERGARLDAKDTMWQGTPEGWARHEGRTDIADFLHAAEHADPTPTE
jgi:ankyrin repeat protein